MRIADLPPGLLYTVRKVPQLMIPPVVIYLSSNVLENQTNLRVNRWIIGFLCAFWFPRSVILNGVFQSWRNERDARRLGAVLAPKVPNKLPGGVEKLWHGIWSFRDSYPADTFDTMCKQYGNSFRMVELWEEKFLTCEPEHIKAMLATQFDKFEKSKISKFTMDSLLGTGVFNSDGEMWRFHRAMTRPFFAKERISHYDIFDKQAEDAISLLKARLREGYDVDFQDLVSRFTLDSATSFLFGQNVSSLSAGLPYPPDTPLAQAHNNPDHPANIFAKAFLDAQTRTSFRFRLASSWPLAEFWKDKVKEPRKVVDEFMEPILKEVLRKKREEKQLLRMLGDEKESLTEAKEIKEGGSLLEHLVNYTEDETVLKDEIMNILIAGRDTTASTLSFAINMLIEHPPVLARLRQEILGRVGRHARPTYEDVKEMKYLRAVLNEVLRLYPAVPTNARMTNTPVLLPPKNPGEKPIYIPAGIRTPYAVMVMHKREDLWGPDAQEFDPDRFLDERLHKYLTPNPFIFLPFNAGPRICLGQQFAYNEMSFFLIRLLQNFFSISLSSNLPEEALPPKTWAGMEGRVGKEKIAPKSHLTMYVRGGLWVRMEEAVEEI